MQVEVGPKAGCRTAVSGCPSVPPPGSQSVGLDKKPPKPSHFTCLLDGVDSPPTMLFLPSRT